MVGCLRQSKGMATNRLEMLKQMIAQDSQNTFARYGLAMEYGKAGQLDQAITEYRALISIDPAYVAAYYHAGQALEKAGELDEARTMYEQGMAACSLKGDAHTKAEIEAALSLLPI